VVTVAINFSSVAHFSLLAGFYLRKTPSKQMKFEGVGDSLSKNGRHSARYFFINRF